MNSLTRPALLTAKACIESIALVQEAFDSGNELVARRTLKRLAANAPLDVAVMDSAIALLDAAEAIVLRSEFARSPLPANDLQDPPPFVA